MSPNEADTPQQSTGPAKNPLLQHAFPRAQHPVHGFHRAFPQPSVGRRGSEEGSPPQACRPGAGAPGTGHEHGAPEPASCRRREVAMPAGRARVPEEKGCARLFFFFFKPVISDILDFQSEGSAEASHPAQHTARARWKTPSISVKMEKINQLGEELGLREVSAEMPGEQVPRYLLG